MSDETPFCPTCGTALALGVHGEMHCWSCPQGHGLAATLTSGYGTAQDDELHRLWVDAKTAQPGTRKCPMCEQPMVVVDLAWTSDEADPAAVAAPAEAPAADAPAGGAPAATCTAAGHEQLDVCVCDEVIWFDAGELEALPADLPNPEPSPDELAKIQQVAQSFGNDYLTAKEAELHAGFTGKLFSHYQRHHRHTYRIFDALTNHALQSADAYTN